MGRSFGLVAASVAAGLALLIGIIAYTTHHQSNNNHGGGGQGLVPAIAKGSARNLAGPSSGINAAPVGPPVDARPASRGNTSGGFGSGGSPSGGGLGGGGLGGSSGQAAAVVTRTCTPGLVQSLVGALSSLLGGGGASC